MNEEFNQNDQDNQAPQNAYPPNYTYNQQVSSESPPFNSIPPQPNQPYQAPYQPPYYGYNYAVPRKRPGKGFGISSMILGIIGTIYTLNLFMQTTTIGMSVLYTSSAAAQYKSYADNERIVMIISTVIEYSVFAILALIFSLVSRKRGYKNGVSMSGLVMSVISLSLSVASMITEIILFS